MDSLKDLFTVYIAESAICIAAVKIKGITSQAAAASFSASAGAAIDRVSVVGKEHLSLKLGASVNLRQGNRVDLKRNAITPSGHRFRPPGSAIHKQSLSGSPRLIDRQVIRGFKACNKGAALSKLL